MLIHASWLAIALGLGATSACLDKKMGARGGTADASTSDTTGATDSAGPDVAACDPTLDVETSGVVRFDDFGMSFSPVVLDGTTIYGTRRGDLGDGTSVRHMIAVDVETGARTPLPEGDGDQLVLDGRDETLVYLTLRPDFGLSTLGMRDMRTGEVVELARGTEERRLSISPGAYAWDQGRHMVERGAAAWGEQANTYTTQAEPARVKLYRDGEVETLWEGESLGDPPYLRSGRVSWVTWGEDGGVWLKEPGRATTMLAHGDIRYHTLTDRAAWWIAEGRLMRHDFASGEQRAVHAGPCNVLVADAERVASVCDGEPDESGYAMARLGTPIVFDDAGATALKTRGGDLIAGLRVMGRRVAWVEYPGSSGCYTGYDDIGELVVSDVLEPDAPALVATVVAGCWCCDAYWPALEIVMSPRGLAWNYPRNETNNATNDYPRGALGSVGWALFAGCE